MSELSSPPITLAVLALSHRLNAAISKLIVFPELAHLPLSLWVYWPNARVYE
jgi:hypothetical protein